MRPLAFLATAFALVACASSSNSNNCPKVAEVAPVAVGGTALALATPPPDEPRAPVIDDSPQHPRVGDPAPPFTTKVAFTGHPTLTKGKVTVIHFFATWCGPCKHSLPKLQKLETQYAARGLMTIGLSVDDETAGVAEFVKANGVKFATGFDEGHQTAERYKIGTMPTTFIIDREGTVRGVIEGYHDGDDAEIETLVNKHL